MGLFDGYQFSDSPQGGLIDRLLAQLGAQGQYQPSQGFSPMDANASIQPQQQNAPIAVGSDYMMPRIGSGFQQNVQPSAVPPQNYTAQPAPPQQQQQAMPAFLQQPQSSPLATSFQSWANTPVGNPMAALANGIASLSSGRRTDPTGQAQQNAQDQFRALVPILGEQKATLAILNPEYGKTMVEQALKGKQYAFTTLPDGTVLRQDAHAGTAEPVYSGSTKPEFGIVREDDGKKVYGWKDPSKRNAPNAGVTEYKPAGSDDERGTVTGPDGKPITIPPGVDRKTFVNEISKANAKAQAGELTEAQAKSTIYASKMELAEKNLKGLDGQYNGVAGGYMRGTEILGAGGNAMQSENYQKYKQARDNFITALLRQESGAAIGKEEFTRYERELFPQPGDGPGVITQKREARRVAIEGMKKGAGPGYKSSSFESGGATTTEAKADPLGIR